MLDKNKVKQWYLWGIWTKVMVANAVKKNKLTVEDYKDIVGEEYEESDYL